MNIDFEVKAVRKLHPDWSFERSWNHVVAVHPEGVGNSTVEENRVQAKLAPQREKEAHAKFAHIEVIARRLMDRDRKLTFGAALEITRNCLPRAQADIKDLLQQPAVKAGEPKLMVVEGVEWDRATKIELGMLGS